MSKWKGFSPKYKKRTDEYHARLRDKGLKRLQVYVPQWAVDQTKTYAATLRKSAGISYKTPEQEAVEYLENQVEELKTEIKRLKGHIL